MWDKKMLAQPLPMAQIWNEIRVFVSNFFSLNHITKCFCLGQIKLHVGSEYQEVQTMKFHLQLYRQGHVRRNRVSNLPLEKLIHCKSIPSAQGVHCVRIFLTSLPPSLILTVLWFVVPGTCWNIAVTAWFELWSRWTSSAVEGQAGWFFKE